MGYTISTISKDLFFKKIKIKENFSKNTVIFGAETLQREQVRAVIPEELLHIQFYFLDFHNHLNMFIRIIRIMNCRS